MRLGTWSSSHGILVGWRGMVAGLPQINGVDEGIAQQLAEFGSDIGLVVALLKDHSALPAPPGGRATPGDAI